MDVVHHFVTDFFLNYSNYLHLSSIRPDPSTLLFNFHIGTKVERNKKPKIHIYFFGVEDTDFKKYKNVTCPSAVSGLGCFGSSAAALTDTA